MVLTMLLEDIINEIERLVLQIPDDLKAIGSMMCCRRLMLSVCQQLMPSMCWRRPMPSMRQRRPMPSTCQQRLMLLKVHIVLKPLQISRENLEHGAIHRNVIPEVQLIQKS